MPNTTTPAFDAVTDPIGANRAASQQRSATNDVLVDAQWLEERLDAPELRVVEVDVSPKAYNEGHITGAVLWSIYQDLKSSDYQLVDNTAIEALIARSGIGPDSVVVFYGYAPAMGFWLMKLYGHADVRVLDIDRGTWQREGRAWTNDVTTWAATEYHLGDKDERIWASQTTVENAIADPECMILDVRTDEEYRGERFWPSGGLEEGGRAGHIPSAVHLAANDQLDDRGAFRSATELRRFYAAVDLPNDREVISYCTIGGRACTAWFVLTYLLGQQHARVYDGSWAEWGRDPTTPVERAFDGGSSPSGTGRANRS
jgi:thiosulfate/3-mercaptopyruvate sulfurtransferase